MKRLVKMRSSNLRVLITSATLDGVKVSKFFSGCPVMNIPGQLFPVEKLYSSEHPKSYIESSKNCSWNIKDKKRKQALQLPDGPMDIQSSLRQKKGEQDYQSLRKALCRGYGNQLAERMLHHNGFRTLGYRSLLVQVHPSSVLETNEDGRLPDYVVYHELINTSRPFMRNVCAVDMSWVAPILKKLEKMDIHKLSGGLESEKIEQVEHKQLQPHNSEVSGSNRGDSMESRIQAARERYLARKAKK